MHLRQRPQVQALLPPGTHGRRQPSASPLLITYAVQEFGHEFFAEAWQEFFLWDRVPEDLESSNELGTTFDPFFVFEFVADDGEEPVPEGWPTEPVGLHFLHHDVESAPDFQREAGAS